MKNRLALPFCECRNLSPDGTDLMEYFNERFGTDFLSELRHKLSMGCGTRRTSLDCSIAGRREAEQSSLFGTSCGTYGHAHAECATGYRYGAGEDVRTHVAGRTRYGRSDRSIAVRKRSGGVLSSAAPFSGLFWRELQRQRLQFFFSHYKRLSGIIRLGVEPLALD